ncbi:hypothetical protein P3T18_004442, partial [Paraburkholderia sp. GAS199]|uniref:beta strand repeat-containing protein n=1 Tax=Paraburkholderia sp. GAS199 TaxID=3035126 RepID=UPI003D1CFC9F
MAASMTVSELQQAGAMIAAGNLSGFYGFMADQGYNYAILAGDLVSGSSFSGAAAVNYLIASAKSQGVTITPTTLSAIEKDMATQWVSALESAAAASSTGTVDADLTYSQTLAFHTQVFADFNLGPQTWTLSTPGKVLSASDMESSWQSMLGQLSTPVTGPVASEAQLTAAMEWAAIHNPDPQLAQQAQSWVNQNVFNVGADIASFVKGATPQNQIGQPIDGGIQYTDSSGTTLTQYINTFSDIYGVPQYTVTEDIWALPVTSPTVTVTALKDGLLVNASASANTTVSANGVVSTSSANVVIGAGDSGAADQANIAGNNNAVTLQTGAVAASLNGGGNSITANGNASGSTFTLEGTGANADTANLAGATDITVLLGDATTEAAFVSTTATIKSLSGGGTINGATGDNLNILGTNVTLNATGGQYSLTGSDVVNAAEGQISFGANTQAQIYGTADGVNVTSGDSVGIHGGGNSVNAAAGSLTALYGTGGIFDTVYATGAQFGGKAADGEGTGIDVQTNAQASIFGSNDGVNVAAGASVGVHGGGNTVNATAGALAYLTGTNGVFDAVYATGDQYGAKAADGEATGILVDTNSQAYIFGSNNGVNILAGASVGLHGGGETVNSAAGALAYLTGTNGVFDAVYANGDQYGAKAADGEATGILVDTNSQAYIFGSNNGVNILAGASVGLHGGGETV